MGSDESGWFLTHLKINEMRGIHMIMLSAVILWQIFSILFIEEVFQSYVEKEMR